MDLRNFYICINIFNKYIVTVITFICPSLCGAVGVYEDKFEDVYEHIAINENQWHEVKFNQPHLFGNIFSNQEARYWPALPVSYEWRRDTDAVIKLYKHFSAANHKFDFVTYPIDNTRCNFLSRWDDVTYYSFAHTRAPAFSNASARDSYPMRKDAYMYNNENNMKGHCIDFGDTIGLSLTVTIPTTYINKNISTSDPRNYVPEPLKSHWGTCLRKCLVGEIRDTGGCYAQYMYYNPLLFKTIDGSQITDNGTAIPDGIYFARIDATPRSYYVPWNHKIHATKVGKPNRTNKNDWHDRLSSLESPDDFFPSPYFHDRSNAMQNVDFVELTKDKLLRPGILSFQQKYQVRQAADHEVRNVFDKTIFIDYQLCCNEMTSTEIERWLDRLTYHANYMSESGFKNFIPKKAWQSLLTKLCHHPEIDPDHCIYDFLKQLYEDNTAASISACHEKTIVAAKQRPLTIRSISEIDLEHLESLSKDLCKIIRQLIISNDIVQLRNLTTTAAPSITNILKELDIQNENKASIEYSVSPTRFWNVHKKFSDEKIIAKRIDF